MDAQKIAPIGTSDEFMLIMKQVPGGTPGKLELVVFDLEEEAIYESHPSTDGNSGLALCSSPD